MFRYIYLSLQKEANKPAIMLQQPNASNSSDLSSNLLFGGAAGFRAMVEARARADVVARAAIIFRACARLEEAMAAATTPARPVLI